MAKISKLSDFNESVETPTIEQPIVDNPIETSNTKVDESGKLEEKTETPITDTNASKTVEETNQSSFELPSYEDEAEGKTETPNKTIEEKVTDWREAIKKADKKELFKELGLDDFALELNEHLKNGGNAIDYLNAKAVDWAKVPDTEVVMSELKKEYPDATNAQLERLFNKKYSQTEIADEEDKEDGLLLMKSDARKLREKKIAEQQSFKIPEPKKIEQVDNSAELQQAAEAARQQAEIANQFYANHEATKSLLSSKRVAVDLGESGSFNFNVDKPEVIMRAITDGNVWQKMIVTPQGEPDVQKLQQLALFAANPKKFVSDLVNYGKSLGVESLVKEGQNAKKPSGSLTTQTDVKPTYKAGKFGG